MLLTGMFKMLHKTTIYVHSFLKNNKFVETQQWRRHIWASECWKALYLVHNNVMESIDAINVINC